MANTISGGIVVVLLFGSIACQTIAESGSEVNVKLPGNTTVETSVADTVVAQLDSLTVVPIAQSENPAITDLEKAIRAAGLVEVQELESAIYCNLKYSTTDNFLGEDVYGDFDKCFLQPEAAAGLAVAQAHLEKKHPGWHLSIFDAVRPRRVQQQMWDLVDYPIQEKVRYVSNPKNGSLHNYGAAVDITIVTETGEELDMGTPFDYFGELAYPRKETALLAAGLLSQEVIENRRLLREVMYHGGFTVLPTEWWHFNFCSRAEAAQRYTIIE